MCSDVASLVFKTVKRLVAHGALIRSGGRVLAFWFGLRRHHDKRKVENREPRVFSMCVVCDEEYKGEPTGGDERKKYGVRKKNFSRILVNPHDGVY